MKTPKLALYKSCDLILTLFYSTCPYSVLKKVLGNGLRLGSALVPSYYTIIVISIISMVRGEQDCNTSGILQTVQCDVCSMQKKIEQGWTKYLLLSVFILRERGKLKIGQKKKIAKEVGRSFLKWGSLQIVPFTYWSKKVCVSSITATQSWKSNAHISVRSRFLKEVSAPESTSFELSTEFSVIPHPVQLEQIEHAM